MYDWRVQFRLPGLFAPSVSAARRTLEIEGRIHPIRVVRHVHARRYVLRLTEDGTLRLTVPRYASVRDGLAFVADQAEWVAREWRRLSASREWGAGTVVLWRGVRETIRVDDGVVSFGPEAVLTAAGASIRATVEAHLRRLEDLQNIALGFDGVEKVYAVQAGREVRILVRPDHVDDERAREIARDVVKRIEEQLSYPGQIRVTVIRETRAVDYAR